MVGVTLFYLGQSGKALLGFLQSRLELGGVHFALGNLLVHLGYGSGVYDTNYNGQAAANIANRNAGASIFSSGIGLAGSGLNAWGRYYGGGSPGGGNSGFIDPATGQWRQ